MKKYIIGAYATIQFNDEETPLEGAYFSFGSIDEDSETDSFGVPDNKIFYFCDDVYELNMLKVKGHENFIILSYELEYRE